MKYHEKLKERYLTEIRAWDWKDIETEAHDNPCANYDSGADFLCYLGSVMSLFPSGKYYMSWTTNQTARDIIRDREYAAALEEVAEENDMWITSSEGNPTDLFAGTSSCDDIWHTEGKFIYDGETIAETEAELREWMEDEGYYPNVFEQDDHGGTSYYQFDDE